MNDLKSFKQESEKDLAKGKSFSKDHLDASGRRD